jgi:hypothetical protein
VDKKNRFLGRGTFLLFRLEALLGLAVAVAAAAAHLGEIRWGVFVAFFAWIDVVGYLPGALAHRASKGRPISKTFPALYNATHSFLVNGALALAWSLLVKPEWALVAIPIHLLGDRALFGNFFKSFATPFEPELLPQFAAFERSLAASAPKGVVL